MTEETKNLFTEIKNNLVDLNTKKEKLFSYVNQIKTIINDYDIMFFTKWINKYARRLDND